MYRVIDLTRLERARRVEEEELKVHVSVIRAPASSSYCWHRPAQERHAHHGEVRHLRG